MLKIFKTFLKDLSNLRLTAVLSQKNREKNLM